MSKINKHRSVVIIPARFGSSRFPGKPLVKLLGKPLILWVAELSAIAVGSQNVYVATEDKRIVNMVQSANFQTIMTSKDSLTGTDRLAEASQHIEADIYINVQGDEPLVKPSDIVKIRDAKIDQIDKVINGFSWINNNEDPDNVNIPKVVTNENNDLVYISRKAIPGFKNLKYSTLRYKKQVCIYAFTKEELLSYKNYGRKSKLEQYEDIEILRFLEIGKVIKMIETEAGSLAIDVPEDVPKVEDVLKKKLT